MSIYNTSFSKGKMLIASLAVIAITLFSSNSAYAGILLESNFSTPVVETLSSYWVLILLVIAGVFTYALRKGKKYREIAEASGATPPPHAVKSFGLIFLTGLIVFGIVIWLLFIGLGTEVGNINGIMFASLPYVVIAIFIAGTVYRYTKNGFKVSSLSTQFLEGKQLFWGSQPFHWGLLVLFIGHLIAFLFPSAVLAWNGQPVRLLILEISSFVFALGALIGLILLIKRRLFSRSLLVVTNRMDMVVYLVLLTQIISGLSVAYFVRWGSSWFASVLTPYLRSVFSFDPDIAAISAAPFLVQLHIISAFVMIALIPFSRFMHFMVAPIDYAWRTYQQVVWNWNRKTIRKSTKHTYGKEPRNH